MVEGIFSGKAKEPRPKGNGRMCELSMFREWAFQKSVEVEITAEMSASEVMMNSGKLKAWGEVIRKADAMLAEISERSEDGGT
ncbi:hypothetical protein ACFW34_35195 [Streptomyces sp. NPDC058848]|uniref:hypothetical protein n=1 Tax=Streptomyces sp. NPDC058848 TaxID=3346650 RepID=UPI00368B7CB7